MSLDSKTTVPSSPVSTTAQFVVLGGGALAMGAGEWARWSDAESRASALTEWLCGLNADWLPFMPWLILAPVFWNLRRGRPVAKLSASVMSGGVPELSTPTWTTWLWAMGVLVLSLIVSILVARGFGDVPPAYHDEFSYVFQAKTFLAGRLWFPSFEPMPQLFDQVHVLNEGHFASRYFPGVGAWLAPFVAMGNGWAGEWTAAALAACCTFWMGREVGGEFAGRVAGVLAALSPGLALFSNLLLAHHPTLMGLTFFIWMYLLARRTGMKRYARLAGIGLTFAMLCRPMTAFGVGLPFGMHFAWWLLRGGQAFPVESGARKPDISASLRHRSTMAAAMAGPLIVGFVILLGYNRAITGNPLVSPYQLYTDIYTPRHVYGFNNVERGEQRLGPKVLENYDRWAAEVGNLTPQLASRNVWRRLRTSLRWTLGIVPLVAAALVTALSRGTRNIPCRLIGAAMFSLHAVHVPYWFEGIMGWHYVFESAPLWLVLYGEGTRRLWISWRLDGRRAMRWWWGGVTGAAVAVNLVTLPAVWPGRLKDGINEVAFSRARYAEFERQAQELAGGRRAIIFVEPDPFDRHIDYVVNEPALDSPILIARYEPDEMELSAARSLFADRAAFLYRATDASWEALPDVEVGPDP